ncbi:YoaK family protein [Mucilaginibacter sp.]|uniref:YoaK family protein n=1 Tax=Mucilaginibacter sp. TaxID=1882438 RepID=UPI0026371336|nr:YoaK family protein [Mucilaginibacter sp.]MDB5130166.1 putative rane protein YoaK, family [Mucilaginibacter sp.]
MLRQSKSDRTLKENLLLASSTAVVSGITNVVGMVAFLAFTSNITGHVANLAKHIVEQNFAEIIVFLIWLFMFFAGAFLSSFIVRSLEDKSYYRAHSIPVIIEIVILLFVAIYGHHFYEETQTEREIVIAAILFSMGLQNSLVSIVSGGLIKSSHLTGLFTDLGGDISDWLHPKSKKTVVVRDKIFIRLTVLGFYFLGGIIGGYFFNLYEFAIFYFIPVILLTILYYDVSNIALHKLTRKFSRKNAKIKTT